MSILAAIYSCNCYWKVILLWGFEKLKMIHYVINCVNIFLS